ncbi:hypothetical protein [Phyllobacterium sp. SB3]|uniref:hypothetical protein n=1 Tax=Phyllobacterium sp. SB3 TaxID=3156073 RepID=UPI0032AFBA41
MGYNGTEIGIELDADVIHHDSDEIFAVRLPGIPANWKPVFDEESNAVIGWVEEWTGLKKIYDLEGKFVGMEELPLENVYIVEDILLLFVGITEIKWILQGGKEAAVVAGRQIGRSASLGIAAALISRSALVGLRISFRQLTKREIFKFTGTTAVHMAEKGRYVPTHVLYLAARYGKRMADPQGVAGAVKFILELEKYDKTGQAKKYTLELVLRTKDWTVLHFLYK